MVRRPRIHVPGALYHVITRGNRRHEIFLDDRDLDRFLTYLAESKKRYSFCLYAYALMRNHLHLLLEVGEVSLSRIMQSLLSRYGRYFNMSHGEVGHLLQGRYKAIVCDKDAYLLELVRYIHLNPVRGKIVEAPENYVWSGHLSYLGKAGGDLIDEEFVLGQLSENRSVARQRYRQFVWEGISGEHQEKDYQVKDQRYLGEDDFIEWIEKETERSESWVYDVALEAISERAGRAMGIKVEKLHSVTREREGACGRGLVVYMAKRISDYTIKELADYFRRSAATISEAIVKVEDHLEKDKALEKTVSITRMKLIEGRKRKYRISDA